MKIPAQPEESLISTLLSNINPTPLAHSNPINAPLLDCFDFSKIQDASISISDPVKFYLVAFRSVRSAAADDKLLYTLDEAAHLEALDSGDLLKYWYGGLNAQRECLAMCIWSSREAALKAARLPAHIQAAAASSKMYTTYTLERYWLELSPLALPAGNIAISLNLISQQSMG